jgi:hypothetical protein
VKRADINILQKEESLQNPRKNKFGAYLSHTIHTFISVAFNGLLVSFFLPKIIYVAWTFQYLPADWKILLDIEAQVGFFVTFWLARF